MRGELVLRGTPLTGHLAPERKARIAPATSFMQIIRTAADYDSYRLLQTLRLAGTDIKEIVAAGYSNLNQLQAAGYTATELASSGIPTYKLAAAGLAPPREGEQRIAPPPPKIPEAPAPLVHTENPEALIMHRLERMGIHAGSLQEAGFSTQELKEIAGLSDTSLKTLGYELKGSAAMPPMSLKPNEDSMLQFAEKARKSGIFTPSQLRSMGMTTTQLTKAKFSLLELRRAGYSANDSKQAGYTLEQLKAAGYSARSLLAAGYDINALKKAGYSTAELVRAINTGPVTASTLAARRNLNPAGTFSAPALGASTTAPTSRPAASKADTSNPELYSPRSFSMSENPKPYSSENTAAVSKENPEELSPHSSAHG